MPLNIPVDQESIRGIKSSSVAGITVKPVGFTFNPGAEQKRVPSFDSQGYKTPGYPALISKDYKATFTWGQFNSTLTTLATAFDDEFTSAVVFATTLGNDFEFGASKMIVDGQSLQFDPLGDNLSVSFFLTDPEAVEFG